MSAPQHEHHERLVVDGANHLIGEGLPSFTLVRSGGTSSNGEGGVEQQHATFCPGRQIPVCGNGDSQVGMEFLEDVHQRWWRWNVVLHGEAETMCLTRAMVRILPQYHHLRIGVRRAMKGGKDVVMSGIHRVVRTLVRDE